MDAKVKKVASFFAEAGDDPDLTATVGSFKTCNKGTKFDNIFEEACGHFKDVWKVDARQGLVKNDFLDEPAAMAQFKGDLLGQLQQDCNQMVAEAGDDGDAGTAPLMYDNVSALFDVKVNELIEESATVGDLMPIKSIDFPLLVKSHIKESFNSIVASVIPRRLFR